MAGSIRGKGRSRRITASGDVEVSAYLEIAKEKGPQTPRLTDTPRASEGIIILDFGSQYNMLIARRVRECQVYCEVVSPTATWDQVKGLNPKGIILSGGPASVYSPSAPRIPPWVFEHKLPVLGICYGMQVLTYQLGGRVVPSEKSEYGHAILHPTTEISPVLHGLSWPMPVWMSHGDQISEVPPGFKSLAYTDNSPIAMMSNGQGLVGLQFHPEVVHTPQGTAIIANFLEYICGCQRTWTPANFVSDSLSWIQGRVGHGKVLCALSGGVDSSVTAMLMHQAVGNQLTCIFVNNGLLRREEAERVLNTFRDHQELNIHYVDASERFLQRLQGIIDPEEKRHLIGEEFIHVFEEEASALGPVDFLAQGTLYPDVIESQPPGSTTSAKIKTHHNVGGLPKGMRLQLVEPLRYLFKDETRQVGLALGLPEDMVFRQPFPGPGLAIRIIGEVTPEKLAILRSCDWIVMDEVKRSNLYRDLWQSFAVLTDTRSVGVMGDHRTYGYLVAVRVVTGQDAMTADWARLPYEVLSKISTRIVNEVPQVNRVVYDITSKPPGTIEWE